MAFKLKIDSSEAVDCRTLKIWDTSGVLGINGNTTGWDTLGVEDPYPSYIQNATSGVTIVTPENVSYTFDLTTVSNAQFFALGVEYMEIVPSDLGYTTGIFSDGVYTFQYSVYVDALFDPVTYHYTASITKYIMCNHECVVNQLWDAATSQVGSCESCAKDKLALAQEAQSYLTSAKFAANCGMTNKAAEILKKIDNLNEFKKCSYCN
jgi:hypothetical protein